MRMMPCRADAAALLARALRVSAAAHDVAVLTLTSTDRPWASATFEGTRHGLALTLVGDHAERWLALLPDADLPLRGHIVADLVVDAVATEPGRVKAAISALTLAER